MQPDARHPDCSATGARVNYRDAAALAVRMAACDRHLVRLERHFRELGEPGYAAAVLTARDELAGRLVKKAVPR